MAGRDRTCGAPRFRRALYPLSYGHVRDVLLHVSTLRLRRRRDDGRGWDRTSGLLCVRQTLCRLSYSPWIRDKDSNLDLHVQSVASFRVRRSRSVPASPRIPGSSGVRAAARQAVLSVPSSASPTVFSKPLAYPSTLDRLRPGRAQPTERPAWRGFGARLRRAV